MSRKQKKMDKKRKERQQARRTRKHAERSRGRKFFTASRAKGALGGRDPGGGS